MNCGSSNSIMQKIISVFSFTALLLFVSSNEGKAGNIEDYFTQVAFEFVAGTEQSKNVAVKWTNRIKYGVFQTGHRQKEINGQVTKVLGLVGRATGLDIVSKNVDSSDSATSLVITVVSETDTLRAIEKLEDRGVIEKGTEGSPSWKDLYLAMKLDEKRTGFCAFRIFTDKLDSNVIASVILAEDFGGAESVQRCITRSLLQSFGVLGKLPPDVDSILSENTDRTEISELDTCFLKLLYHWDVSAGLSVSNFQYKWANRLRDIFLAENRECDF